MNLQLTEERRGKCLHARPALFGLALLHLQVCFLWGRKDRGKNHRTHHTRHVYLITLVMGKLRVSQRVQGKLLKIEVYLIPPG